MKQIISYQFSIETKSGVWQTSPEYKTEEECFAAALRCKKALAKRYQRITFFDNMRVVEA